MAFKLLSAFVALLFVFDRSLDVQAALARHPSQVLNVAPAAEEAIPAGTVRMQALGITKRPFGDHIKVHDADEDKILEIANTPDMQLPSYEVPKTFDGLLSPVMQGNGVLFQRESKVQLKWHKFQTELRKKGISYEDHYAKQLKWDGPYPANKEPAMIDERQVKNEDWVKFERAQFPVKLPEDTEHVIAWLRAPLTTKECFKPVGKEIPPSDHEIFMANLKPYIEFINGHDVFGTNVDMKDEDKLQFAKDLMEVNDSLDLQEKLVHGEQEEKAAKAYRDAKNLENEQLLAGLEADNSAAEKIDLPHVERAKEAMLWAVQNITRMIEAKYPGRRFVWFRVNRWIRTHHLNQIHIFLEKEPGTIEKAVRISGLKELKQLANSHPGAGILAAP
ncbi:hypothetical protein PGTUg99_030597 [Puccinia graminis f. sp. tritici]|uniref:Uncharacterized protein n=2 Tax=Puccinia graminis f. sp. tritici TaxID=56615 RepID=A0A5B0S758_PUCGR|nr:hypothetical protein PGTUg99_030597 [Puccinia graminis f. sp. tritici]